MPTTTSDLFSVEAVRDLLVEPVFKNSAVLPFLRRIPTSATTLYLPTVGNGTAGWYSDLDPIAEAGVQAKELAITPKKCAAIQSASNETINDANAAGILGAALTDAVIRTVDAGFVNGAAPDGPAGLPGVTGVSTVTGDTKTLAVYLEAISEIQTAGGTPTVIFVAPSDWAALQALPSTVGSNVSALQPLAGPSAAAVPMLYGVAVSPVAALAAGTAWVVDGTRTCVIERTPATVAVNDGPLFASDGAMIRALMRLELAACYPLAVCKISAT
jgi:HK97 family phage major capsid protein